MRVFLNPGHAPDGDPDPGACGYGLRECDVAKSVADLVAGYLAAAGVEVVGNMQSDSLHEVVSVSNCSGADVFISIHCNACNGTANGTEVCHITRNCGSRNKGSEARCQRSVCSEQHGCGRSAFGACVYRSCGRCRIAPQPAG